MELPSVSTQFNPSAAYAEQQQMAVSARQESEAARQSREAREVVSTVGDRVSLSQDARRDAAPQASEVRPSATRVEQERLEAVQRQENEQPEQTPRSVTRALEAYSQGNALN